MNSTKTSKKKKKQHHGSSGSSSEAASPLLINNKNHENDIPTTQTIMCLPNHYKKSQTKEGDEFRFYIQIALALHLIFSVLSLFLMVTFFLSVRQALYTYLAYYIFMTLSRLATVLYVFVLAVGLMYGVLDMFSVLGLEGGMRAFFMYVLINLAQGYLCWVVARKMMKYTYSLNELNKKQRHNNGA